LQTQNPNAQPQTYQPQTQQPQAAQSMQQNRMTEPPQLITIKDLNYLTDSLSWELDIIKKFNHFERESQDTKVKNCLKKAAQMHQKHYSVLLKHINPNNSASKIQS